MGDNILWARHKSWWKSLVQKYHDPSGPFAALSVVHFSVTNWTVALGFTLLAQFWVVSCPRFNHLLRVESQSHGLFSWAYNPCPPCGFLMVH